MNSIVDSLPVTFEERGSRIAGTFGVLIGGGFAVLPVVALVVAVADEGLSRDALEALAWFAIPFLLSLACLLLGHQSVRPAPDH